MRRAWLALALCACAPAPPLAPVAKPAWDAALPRFHCSFDGRCPELAIAGESEARLGGRPSPFRGIGDPSLEFDPETGQVWLAYSWLDVVVSAAGPPPVADFAIRTHLARSADGGRSFERVDAANRIQRRPDRRGRAGHFLHEVPTLARAGARDWRLAWLRYFDPLGEAREYAEPRLVGVRAAEPASFGRTPEETLGAEAALADCAGLTEPALFAEDGQLWLAASCIVFAGGTRRPERERLVLLRESAGGFTPAGALLGAADARALGGDRVEQADLARARDGRLLLFVTPIRERENPAHQGCVVLEVEDLAAARVRREADGRPFVRAVVSADGNGLGPGMCTYDAASETGVLMVITRFDLASDPPDLLFSLRRTGFHP
jgi:hypothetical protein